MSVHSNDRLPDSLETGELVGLERIRLILFDLDGTLVNSVPDLAWCGNEMLRRLDMPQRDQAEARNWVGNSLVSSMGS